VTGRIEAKVVVRNKHGLHARPSSVLAQAAIGFPDTAIRLKKGALEVDAKSIMELILLEAHFGTELLLTAEGPRAQEAVDLILGLFERQFDLRY
jgi:phosphotransferase system HPr (HPr) family protein